MKRFEEICRMTQKEVKSYAEKFLKLRGYDVANEDGFLYAKGDIPVLLVAHMDTVHKEACKRILTDGKVISSPQGIGGDDRCGIYIITEIIQELKCSVLFCEDEEIGGVGARKFTKSKYIKELDVNYIVEFDRRGNKNAVFYSCDNKDFTKFITETTGFTKEYGSFSDISIIAPAAKIAAVNLSCGYYNAHTTNEYVKVDEMNYTIEVAKKLVKTESKSFEYVERKYDFYDREHYDTFYNDMYYGGYQPKQLKFGGSRVNEFELELEVIYNDGYGDEAVDCVSGMTKAECWANFFMSNPDVCFSMIVDYSFV